jgi:divalent metal cation (Fe/Co/Zn/Cd) transporter
VALLAIRWSATPPDPGHPYGHHKAEYFSGFALKATVFLRGLMANCFEDSRSIACFVPQSTMAD